MTVNRTDTARLGSASPPRNRPSNNVGRPAGVIRTTVAINPVIAHPMLSRGNEVANRTNFVAVHESGIDAVDGSSAGT
jgi:hypothetical protein